MDDIKKASRFLYMLYSKKLLRYIFIFPQPHPSLSVPLFAFSITEIITVLFHTVSTHISPPFLSAKMSTRHMSKLLNMQTLVQTFGYTHKHKTQQASNKAVSCAVCCALPNEKVCECVSWRLMDNLVEVNHTAAVLLLNRTPAHTHTHRRIRRL